MIKQEVFEDKKVIKNRCLRTKKLSNKRCVRQADINPANSVLRPSLICEAKSLKSTVIFWNIKADRKELEMRPAKQLNCLTE